METKNSQARKTRENEGNEVHVTIALPTHFYHDTFFCHLHTTLYAIWDLEHGVEFCFFSGIGSFNRYDRSMVSLIPFLN